MLQGKFYSFVVSLTWIMAAAALCSCQPIVNRHSQRWKVLFEDRIQEKHNFEFLLSLIFRREQGLIRTVSKHQVSLTSGQVCKWSFLSPFSKYLPIFPGSLCREQFWHGSAFICRIHMFHSRSYWLWGLVENTFIHRITLVLLGFPIVCTKFSKVFWDAKILYFRKGAYHNGLCSETVW